MPASCASGARQLPGSWAVETSLPPRGGARRREDPEAGSAWACLGLFRAGLLPFVTAQSRGISRFCRSLVAKLEEEGAGVPATCSLGARVSAGNRFRSQSRRESSQRRRQELDRVL